MRRYTIGILAGMGVFLGAALAVEAQGITITGTGPLAVYHTDSQSTYTATVTYTGNFNFKLWVFRNGVQKYVSLQYMYSSPGVFNLSQLVTGMNTWGMVAGDTLKYRGKAWVSGSSDIDDWFVTVSQGTSKLIPDKDRPLLPYREELLAEVVRREEREWA